MVQMPCKKVHDFGAGLLGGKAAPPKSKALILVTPQPLAHAKPLSASDTQKMGENSHDARRGLTGIRRRFAVKHGGGFEGHAVTVINLKMAVQSWFTSRRPSGMKP
jgi:hypothetical protein